MKRGRFIALKPFQRFVSANCDNPCCPWAVQEVKKMESKRAAILVLAIAAAVAIVAGGAYAMGPRASGNGYSTSASYGYRTGPGMMGGYGGYAGWMMGGYGAHWGMMGDNGYPMYQYMDRYWNSTYVP